jgi:hypothetical protein
LNIGKTPQAPEERFPTVRLDRGRAATRARGDSGETRVDTPDAAARSLTTASGLLPELVERLIRYPGGTPNTLFKRGDK